MDSVGNNWSSVVSDRVGNKWGGMNTMVNTMVGNQRSCMDGVVGGSVVDSVMGNWSNSVVRDDGGLANWDGSVGSNGGLDLSQTLGVVSLGDGGVGGSEGLALTESSDLTVSSGD